MVSSSNQQQHEKIGGSVGENTGQEPMGIMDGEPTTILVMQVMEIVLQGLDNVLEGDTTMAGRVKESLTWMWELSKAIGKPGTILTY